MEYLNWYGYCMVPNNMRKLLGIFFIIVTLNAYSQVDDDVYYTVYDYPEIDTIEEKDVYVTNNYYTDYTSRINRFHRRPYYTSYWSYYNPYWYDYGYYGYYGNLSFYWWWSSLWLYGYYPYYNYPYYNYTYWYSNDHYNHHWYNNDYYTNNTYYGPHYKKSNGNENIKTVKTISKVKPKPVIHKVVRNVNKPIKTQTTYTSKPKPQNFTNKVRAYNVVNSRTHNKPTTRVNTSRSQYSNRPKVTTHQTYTRPSRSLIPKTNSFNRVRSQSSPSKRHGSSRPK